MNEEQLESIKGLNKKNEVILSRVETLYNVLKEKYSEYDDTVKSFYLEMNRMDKASSNEYREPFCNAYYLVNNEFANAEGKCIKDSLYGTLNEGWGCLKKEYIESIETRYLNLFSDLEKVVELNSNELEDIIRRVLAYNKVCIFLDELDNMYDKLKKDISGSTIEEVIDKTKDGSKFKLPIHKSLLMRFDPIIKTRESHLNTLASLRDFLIEVIYLLPFAKIK